jgi:uncharacterized repeat protein (TIGR01451 family)
MIKNRVIFRGGVLTALAAILAFAGLFNNLHSAYMQTGSNTIVFERTDGGKTKIFVMHADGTNVTELAEGFGPSYSGDGSKIAYAVGHSEITEIWTMNADGSNKQQLTENWGLSYAPAYSPDGTKIVFQSNYENGDGHIYIMDANGENQQRLNINDSELRDRYVPTWSADGSKIIFLSWKSINGRSSYAYYQADANNSGITTKLTSVEINPEFVQAAVSPDGTKIVIEYQHDLQAFSLDGSNTITNLTDGSPLAVDYPDYAPSGTKIVYRHGTMLHIMNADGTNRVNLDVVGRNPDWNPTAVIVEPTPTPTPAPAIEADVDVDAYASALNVTVGSPVTYTVNVKNLGTHDATGVSVGSAWPAILSVTDIQSSQGSCSIAAGQLECQLGTIAVNGQTAITIVANTTAIGFAGMTFSGAAIEGDPDPANNSQTVGVTVTGPCATPVTNPIQITRDQWRRNDRTGQDELILTIRNISGRSLDPRLIFVFDNLPAGVTVDQNVVSGTTQCAAPLGSPYLVAFAPNGKEWKNMQTVSVRVLFNNPARVGITYDWRLYSGSINP